MRLTLSPIDLAVFAAYFLAVGILAWFASRSRGATRRDYFLGGDKLPWWMIGGSIVRGEHQQSPFHRRDGWRITAGRRGDGRVGPIWIGFNARSGSSCLYLRNGSTRCPNFSSAATAASRAGVRRADSPHLRFRGDRRRCFTSGRSRSMR